MKRSTYVNILVAFSLCSLALLQYAFFYLDSTTTSQCQSSESEKSVISESRRTTNYETIEKNLKFTANKKKQKWKHETELEGDTNYTTGYVAHPGHLKVIFKSLDGCEKPRYMNNTAYREKQCWVSCNNGQICNNNMTDIHQRRGRVLCLPSGHLIGLRKCGTTDVVKWLQYHTRTAEVIVKGNNIPRRTNCPLNYYRGLVPYSNTVSLIQYSPGNILFGSVLNRNQTHLEIQTTMQFLAFLDAPQTRYLITFRNPTDRTLSYIHHAHRMRWIYREKKGVLDPMFVHKIIVKYHSELQTCLKELGERACIHLHSAADGQLQGLLAQGLYVVYLEELFTLLPREKIYINRLETYSHDQLAHAKKIVTFLGHELDKDSNEDLEISANKTRNSGEKSAPLPETIRLLDELYKPFNYRLSKLLTDDSWRYDREDDS